MEIITNFFHTGGWLSLHIFVRRVLKLAFLFLVFGAVFITLAKFNGAGGIPDIFIDHPGSFAAGAIVLVALTMIGVPLAPALIAGAAAWLVILKYLPM